MSKTSTASETSIGDPDARDDRVDEELARYVDPDRPKSFFLYAGAGSGKTRSLVNVLTHIRNVHHRRLSLKGQRVAVITYTNAACEEIIRRMASDALIKVSTIHSFAWDLISPFPKDIRDWLRKHLRETIQELEEKQRKGRSGSKVAQERVTQIASKQHKLAQLDLIRRFEYNPSGESRGRGALTHSEVIGATSWLLRNKETLQRILVSGFPIFLVDESQDTISDFMEALLTVQGKHGRRFCLGLFGDTMQRIYGHGMVDLEGSIPTDWARPAKKMNHRCSHRVVRLINKIRDDVDRQHQQARSNKPEGTVHLFVVPNGVRDKLAVEARVAERMAEITGDLAWSGVGEESHKTLILEHHMAAERFGFAGLFGALYGVEKYRTAILGGDLPQLRLFGEKVLPLVRAEEQGRRFEVARIIRQHSPLIRPEELRSTTGSQMGCLERARRAVQELTRLFSGGAQPTFLAVLRTVAREHLFEIPDVLDAVLVQAEEDVDEVQREADGERPDSGEELEAWNRVMLLPFSEIEPYQQYVSDTSAFGTHQGVKGLEFPRVLVIANDDEARGFTFSHDSLFSTAAKDPSKSGKETAVDRTRRLFYVACSRAEQGLAVVAYSGEPKAVEKVAVERGWFAAEEVEVWDGEGV